MFYRYFWNSAEDEEGRNLASWRGYESGDPLILAYEGEIADDNDIDAVLDSVFRDFNIDPPLDYHGPSMSVGSVIELDGVAYAVERIGFRKVDLTGSRMFAAPAQWRRRRGQHSY